MKFPAMNKQSRRGVNIPEFAGGLNLRDNPVQVNDNQLTDLKNMWYKDGTLRTRPGIYSCDDMNVQIGNPNGKQNIDKRQFLEIEYEKDSQRYILSVTKRETSGVTNLIFCWQGEDKIIVLPGITITATGINYFVVRHNDLLYCFVSNQKIYRLVPNSTSGWIELPEREYYVPLVATNCLALEGFNKKSEEIVSSGIMLEGYNLLSDYYKISYNSFNNDLAPVETGTHPMKYHLLSSIYNADYKGKYVTVEYTKNGNTAMHKLKLDGSFEAKESACNDIDGMKIRIRFNWLCFEDENDNIVYIEEGMENDIVITAPYIPKNRDKELKKIFNMTRSVWFGGTNSGFKNGTRLFLCGNTIESEKALVCWSGLNNPLYFPENSYFYVGDTNEAVTCFGKQSDMLVVFKNNETWYTQYRQNTDITAADLINQTVVDLQASSVYFPITQVNPNIGCAYPDTVCLCRNKLVFVGSDKKVYTLVSNSQYNERNIFCVSEMVDKALKDEGISSACDWNGYYCLSCGKKIYLMDYNSYGYQYITSFSKTEDANKRIPWYCWELPISSGLICAIGNSIIIPDYFAADSAVNCSILGYMLNVDNGENDSILQEKANGALEFTAQKIKSSLQTKFFDFGAPNNYKNIDSVGLSLGYNGGNEITATLLTDGGEEQIGLVLEDEAEERSAGFTKSRILYPAIRSVIRLGVKLECEGNMIVDGMTLEYRMTGRAR